MSDDRELDLPPASVLDASGLRSVIDAWHEGMQILSPEWRYLYINEAAARHARKTRAELIGRTMLECYPGVEKTPMFKVLERCMRDRRRVSFPNDFKYEDGTHAQFELRIQPCPEGLIVLSLERKLPEELR